MDGASMAVGRRRARTGLWLGAMAGAAIVAAVGAAPPRRAGDASDYASMQQALLSHGTPDLRPGDHAGTEAAFRASGLSYAPSTGFDRSPRGPVIGWHFWLYPAATLPARLALRVVGAPEMASFPVTNAVLFAVAVLVAAFGWREAPARRVAFVTLAAGSPVVAYLTWISPEVFTWSCVMLALVAVGNRRHGLGAALAACGSMQNPGAGAVAVYAVASALAERRARPVLLSLVGASLGLLPPAINMWFFGVPSLVVSHGHARLGLVTAHRVASIVTDLDQGFLPHAPVTLLAAAVGLVAAARRRDLRLLGLAPALGLMVLSACTAKNWNSACAGLMRYAVWMLPVLAWAAAGGLPPRRRLGALFMLGGAAQLALALTFLGRDQVLFRGRLASWALVNLPRLYSPEPEIFVERQLHLDWVKPYPLPVAVADAGGNVTKLLVDADALAVLRLAYDVDPVWLGTIATPAALDYLEPPRGAVRLRPVPPARDMVRDLFVFLDGIPPVVKSPPRLVVRVRNRGTRLYWGGLPPDGALGIRARIRDGAGRPRGTGRLAPLPCLAPGEEGAIVLDLGLLPRRGRLVYSLRPHLKGSLGPFGPPLLEAERDPRTGEVRLRVMPAVEPGATRGRTALPEPGVILRRSPSGPSAPCPT